MNIGLLVHHYSNIATLTIANTLRESCRHSGDKLFIFEGRDLGSQDPLFKFYNSLFPLVTGEGLDGLIVASTTVVMAENQLVAARWLSTQSFPIVCIGRSIGGLPTVVTDNESGIGQMFRHLFRHGCRNIAFLTGNLSQMDGTARYEQFLKVQAVHQLPLQPDLIIRGDFSARSGKNAAIVLEPLVRSGRCDAILSSNDDMLFGLLSQFRQAGLRCPEDFLATGYDNTTWSALTDPPLTTVSQNHEEVALTALIALKTLIEGGTVPEKALVPVKPILRCSCGCTRYEQKTNREGIHEIPHENFMLTEYLQSYKLDILMDMLEKNLPSQGILDFAIVRYPTAIPFRDMHRFELPAEATVNFCTINGIRVRHDEAFNPLTLLPEPLLKAMQTPGLILKPLFFGDEIFGYMVAGCEEETERMLDEVRVHLSNLVKGAQLIDERIVMEHRLKLALDELRSANKKLNHLSVRDDLTGLLNRRGFLQEATAWFDHEATGSCLIAYVDMDNLKTINDRYGHEEGDEAICTVSRILCNAVRENDLVARIGGDEFVLLAKGSTDTLLPILEERFESQLQMVATEGQKPYPISFSWGILKADMHDRLEERMREADDKMLTHKKLKKSRTQSIV